MIVFIATLTAKVGKEKEFEDIMVGIVPEVRKEPGNLAYTMCRKKEHPRTFIFYEEYKDQEALASHRRHLKEMGVDLASLLEGPPVIELLEKLAS